MECFQVAETAELVQECVLVKIPAVLRRLIHCLTDQTTLGDKFDINLDSLAGIIHLLIGLRDIFGIWQLYRHLTAFSQKTVQTRNRAGVAPLPQLHPEHDQAGVGIPAAHILNQLDLLRPMLVRMAVRPVRAVFRRCLRPIVSLAPAVDVLPVGVVPGRRFCDSMLLCIQNQGLPVPGRLCYLIHSE